ncbi:MAG: exodeoxyribonuclease VII small subunit [Clostridia bacterium]|nr:exodeoxyribonuclease VII small subunit [Clostridia bacterium]
MAKKKITFESGIQELETLIRALEQGQMPLEESFKAFEKAVELKNALQEMLDEGDRRIRVLTESGERTIEEAKE